MNATMCSFLCSPVSPLHCVHGNQRKIERRQIGLLEIEMDDIESFFRDTDPRLVDRIESNTVRSVLLVQSSSFDSSLFRYLLSARVKHLHKRSTVQLRYVEIAADAVDEIIPPVPEEGDAGDEIDILQLHRQQR